jgi:hypothetical protein
MSAKRLLSGSAHLLLWGLLAALVLVSAPHAHAASKQKSCKALKAPKDPPPVFIRATGVTCDAAGKLAVKVLRRTPQGCLENTDPEHIRLHRPCRVSGFRCTSRPLYGGQVLEATCKRGHTKVVRFQAQDL